LDNKYPEKQRDKIYEIYISSQDLKGHLKLENFSNLEKLDCSHNKFTEIEINNCLGLKKINCSNNQLIKLNIQKCLDLKFLCCSNNLLTNLDLSKNTKLEQLNISNNDFSEQDLSFLSHLMNLKDLQLENYYNTERAKLNIYNRFYGSLEPLKDMSELAWLNIDNTDLDSGLEYLPDSLKYFSCQSNMFHGSGLVRLDKNQVEGWYILGEKVVRKCEKILNLLANKEGEVETMYPWNGLIKDFSQKLQA
jgi:Leucine-rich repeat (LRR) protein